MLRDTASIGAQAGEAQPRITVTGRGGASTTPDMAHVTVGIQTEATTAREASTRCAEAMRRVLDALVAQGTEARHIQTAQLSLMPQQQHSPDGSWRRVGYAASNTVFVKLANIERAGPVVDAVIEAGGDDVTIQGIHLMASDTTTARTEARHAALADARAQAEDIATEMGLRLGTPLAIEVLGGGGPIHPMPRMAHAMAASVAQPVEAGEVEISVEVQVIFAILPAAPTPPRG